MTLRLPRTVCRLLGMLLLSLPCSGCLTRALWGLDDPTVRVVLSERTIDAAIEVMASDLPGGLELDVQRDDPEPLPIATGVGAPRSGWRLSPGPGAEEALALLEGLAEFELEWVELRVKREVTADAVVESSAELQLEGHVVPECFATRIDPAALPARVVAGLQAVGPADFAVAESLPDDVPELVVECTRRLRTLDLGDWLPDDGEAARLAGFVWLDCDYGRLTGASPIGEVFEALEFADGGLLARLEALQSLRLLVVVAGRRGDRLYLLRPDLVWLWSTLVRDGERELQLSSWQAEPQAAPAESPSTPGGSVSPLPPRRVLARGMMRLAFVEVGYEQRVWQNIALKLLLTPATLAIDITLFAIEAWLFGDDDC